MNNLLESLNWRYATKKFDPTKKINSEDLNFLNEAMRLAVSSYGLQPYKILNVENIDLRKELLEFSWGQTQIVDASNLIVFCNFNEVTPKNVDDLVQLKADVQKIPADELKGYGDFMKAKLKDASPEYIKSWTAKQTYLALNNLLIACAHLRIDACPMEGFDPEGFNKILKLEEQGLNAAVVATIGYRSSEDSNQFLKKVRKPSQELFITI